MDENNQDDNNPVTTALNQVFGKLIDTTSNLPAPLAYGSAITIAILTLVLLGGVIPDNLIWLIGIVILAALAAFVFLDWDARKQKITSDEEISDLSTSNTFTINVVVYKIGDRDSVIPGAQVFVSLPKPQTKQTADNGYATFLIAEEFAGATVNINSFKEGYRSGPPLSVKILDDSSYYLPMERLTDRTSNEIRVVQIKPETQSEYLTFMSDYVALGRNPKGDICFPKNTPRISWDHGLIIFQEGGYYYHHLSNKFPTIIHRKAGGSLVINDGIAEEAYKLENHDRLVIDTYEFSVTFTISGIGDTEWTPTKE